MTEGDHGGGTWQNTTKTSGQKPGGNLETKMVHEHRPNLPVHNHEHAPGTKTAQHCASNTPTGHPKLTKGKCNTRELVIVFT